MANSFPTAEILGYSADISKDLTHQRYLFVQIRVLLLQIATKNVAHTRHAKYTILWAPHTWIPNSLSLTLLHGLPHTFSRPWLQGDTRA